MKVGDLVMATGPSFPELALVLAFKDEWTIDIMWCNDGELDSGGKCMFEVVDDKNQPEERK